MLFLGLCKYENTGKQCDGCMEGYFGFPECKHLCGCDIIGSQNLSCDGISGQCNCFTGYSGRDCSKECHPGFYGNDCERGNFILFWNVLCVELIK